MNLATLVLIAAQAMGDAMPKLSFSGSMLELSPQCILSKGARDWKCDPGARIVELISVIKPGERVLRCEVFETMVDGEWQVWDARLYCRRVQSK